MATEEARLRPAKLGLHRPAVEGVPIAVVVITVAASPGGRSGNRRLSGEAPEAEKTPARSCGSWARLGASEDGPWVCDTAGVD